MKRLVLLAGIGLLLSTVAVADGGGPIVGLPTIVVTPHPAPNAPDYGTCLIKCAGRDDGCVRGTHSPVGLRECRLQRSLCDSDCLRYGINER